MRNAEEKYKRSTSKKVKSDNHLLILMRGDIPLLRISKKPQYIKGELSQDISDITIENNSVSRQRTPDRITASPVDPAVEKAQKSLEIANYIALLSSNKYKVRIYMSLIEAHYHLGK